MVLCSPPSGPKDECVEEEDMSLDSEDDAPVIEEPGGGVQESVTQPPLLPQAQEFRPPLSEHESMSFLQPPPGDAPKPLDFEALKSAITLFKASSQRQPTEYEVGGSSPGSFNVNPHQSFLCPSPLTTAYPGAGRYPGHPPFPSSPCGAAQEAALGPGQDDARLAGILPLSQPGFAAAAQDRTSHAPGSSAPPGLVATATGGACFPGLGETGVAVAHGWGHLGGVSSACGTPTSQDDGALGPEAAAARGKAPTPGSANSASGTPNSQGGATPSAPGAARTGNPGGSSTPSSQGSLTPVPSKAAEKALAPAPARGGAHGSGLLPLPQGAGGVNGRGRGGAWGNGPGAVAMGYRGLPPGRSRPRGCREMRGGACVRGFPPGRGRGQPGGYYPDFTQDIYLSWGEEDHWSPGDGYGTHRDGYNGW